MKKIAQRALPLDRKYKIVETFVSADYCNCQNCGKALKNVAIINSDKGGKYYVGMDCAATLSGINSMDIEYFSQSFVLAKSVLAKVNRYLKTAGSVLWVTNFYYSKPNKVEILVLKKEGKYTCIGDALCNFTVDADFCKTYLPSIWAKNNLNFSDFERQELAPILFNAGNCSFILGCYDFTYEYKFTDGSNCGTLAVSICKNGAILDTDYRGAHRSNVLKPQIVLEIANELHNEYVFNSGKKHIE